MKVLSHKYIKGGDIWNIKVKGNIYLIWRSILKALEALRQGFQFCISDVSSSFWYENWTGLGALCHLVDFVHISDTQLQLKDVSFIGSWDWNKLMTMVPNDLKMIVDRSPLLWPLMIIFKIDGFGELLKPEGIHTLQHIVVFYLVVESEMIMKIGIGFGNCWYQLWCNISFGFACTMQSQLTIFDITATWQLLMFAKDVEPTMKMCFIALEIVLHRRKFGSKFIVLIIHISLASQTWKHGYKLCVKDLLVTCFQ